jgi:hypothetical protein
MYAEDESPRIFFNWIAPINLYERAEFAGARICMKDKFVRKKLKLLQ